SSFKPTPLRYANHMAGRACHMVCSTTRRGLTQVLGRFGESAQMDPTTIVQDAISGTVATVVGGLILAGIAWLAWPVRWQIQGRAIKNLIADERRFNFVFSPSSKMAKELTFLADGQIGEGRNENEHSWRIRRGALEILGSDAKIYSRFRFDRSHGVLKHTNDPELRSIPGQYIEPRLERVPKRAA